MKKIICVSLFFVLLLSISECGNPFSRNSSASQAAGSQAPSSETRQTDESSRSSGVPFPKASDGDVPVSSKEVSSKESGSSSSPAADPSSDTRQETLKQTSAALNTKVPLLLPTGVPVEKGRYFTSATVSQTAHYEVNFYETNQPAAPNSKDASKGTLIATVTGTEFKDALAARESITGYTQVDTSTADSLLDLGHKIKAVEDAGLGHAYLTWNEGRWCISIDSPNDPAFQNKDYPDSKRLAKDIVSYLEAAMLPPPQKIGVISIIIWNKSYGTTIEWQNNKTVYQVISDDPMTALKTAVSMKLK